MTSEDIRREIGKEGIEKFMEKVTADDKLFREFSEIVGRDRQLLAIFAKRTKHLDKGVSFKEHIANLQKQFPEYEIEPGSRIYNTARVVKAMLNFELTRLTFPAEEDKPQNDAPILSLTKTEGPESEAGQDEELENLIQEAQNHKEEKEKGSSKPATSSKKK